MKKEPAKVASRGVREKDQRGAGSSPTLMGTLIHESGEIWSKKRARSAVIREPDPDENVKKT